MSYRVRIESFEGPFDLLLYLVSRQKVDIGSISITQIVDQYLAEISRMQTLDMDVASDFLLVASTLLEIKAESLLPRERTELEEEFAELAPTEARDILAQRLIAYKQYKNAAAHLEARAGAEALMFTRSFGPDIAYVADAADYLKAVRLETLARLCAKALARREVFLLESEHIAAKTIPVEEYVRSIHGRIAAEKHLMFSQLLDENLPLAYVVVTFLALLELYKRNMVKLKQKQCFGDISVDYIEGSGELVLDESDQLTSLGA